MITETERLEIAINEAGRLWPELYGDRAALLRRLLDVGIGEVKRQLDDRRDTRQKALERISGSMSKVWPENWREELEADWPR